MVFEYIPCDAEKPHACVVWFVRDHANAPPGDEHHFGKQVGCVIVTRSSFEVVQNRDTVGLQNSVQLAIEHRHCSPQSACILSVYGARMPCS